MKVGSKLKFIYSEKAIHFCKISTVDLTGTTWDKSTVEISQNFVAFSEYMNFILLLQISNHDFEPTFIIFCLN
jgi:hypothetical protein